MQLIMNNNNHENYVPNNENDVEDWQLGWDKVIFEEAEDAADHEDGDNNNHENCIPNNENDVDWWE